jgi:hypothetical protein
MEKYAVELGVELGQKLAPLAKERGFTLSAFVRSLLWNALDGMYKPKPLPETPVEYLPIKEKRGKEK